MLSRNDFVDAAERTVNGVVSVKKFCHTQDRSQAGSYYGDPLLDFSSAHPAAPSALRSRNNSLSRRASGRV